MAFIILLAYTVLIFIRPHEWFEATKNLHILDFVVGANIMFTFMGLRTGRLKMPRVPENFLLLGLLLAVAMSHVAHTYFAGMLFAISEFITAIVIYFLIVINIDTVKKLRIFIWTVILSTSILAIHGIMQYYLGAGLGGLEPIINFAGEVRIRGFGIFNDPNDLALCFVIALPFLLYLFFKKGGFNLKIIALSFAGLFLYSLWLTNSRGGIIGLAVTLLVYFRHSFKGFKWVFFVLLAIIMIITFLPSRFSETLLDESTRGRVVFWGYGNQMFKANPFFGVGYKMFSEYADGRSAHSSFVNMYAETGLFGYFFWLGLIYLSILGLWKVVSNKEYRREKYEVVSFGEAVFASMVGYLTCGFFLSRNYSIILFILIALAVKIRLLASENKVFVGDIVPFYYTRRIILSCIGSILFIYLSTRLLLRFY